MTHVLQFSISALLSYRCDVCLVAPPLLLLQMLRLPGSYDLRARRCQKLKKRSGGSQGGGMDTEHCDDATLQSVRVRPHHPATACVGPARDLRRHLNAAACP